MVPRLSTITSEGSHDGPQKEPTPMRGSPSGFRLACLDGVNSCHEGYPPFDEPHGIALARAAYLPDLSVDANSIKIGAPDCPRGRSRDRPADGARVVAVNDEATWHWNHRALAAASNGPD